MNRIIFAKFPNGFEANVKELSGKDMIEINSIALQEESAMLKKAREEYKKHNNMEYKERVPQPELLYRKIGEYYE
jgi:hypothetical protein